MRPMLIFPSYSQSCKAPPAAFYQDQVLVRSSTAYDSLKYSLPPQVLVKPTIPMEHPITAPWGVHISSADFDRLKGGFSPKEMEDRWLCVADNPDQQGGIVVRFCRSWTGREQIALKVKSLSNGAEIVEITWDRGNDKPQVTEIESKTLAGNICRNILDFESAFQATR